jgi:IgA peptidase M64/CARDB protein/carboxypeptidase family protein
MGAAARFFPLGRAVAVTAIVASTCCLSVAAASASAEEPATRQLARDDSAPKVQRAARGNDEREVVLHVGPNGGARFVRQYVRHRSAGPRPGPLARGLQVTAISATGRPTWAGTVTDPRTVLTDYLDPSGHLTGGPERVADGDVTVRLPIAAEVAHLNVKAPDGTISTVTVPSLATEAAPAAALPSTTIVRGGDPASSVDIVFLGDGYTAGQLGTYANDVTAATNHLLGEYPFSALRDRINVYRVDVVSNQSGADDLCAGTYRDTALGSAYHSTGSDCRALYSSDYNAVANAAASAPAVDTVMVLVNAPTYGGAAYVGGHAFAYNGAYRDEVVAHEFGHSFGLLGDEYSYGSSVPWSFGDPGYPNADDNTDRLGLKWGSWVEPATPLPTSSTSADVPGAYAGAATYPSGIYRPTYDSKMRNLGRPYERVNAELIARRVMAYAALDATAPTLSVDLHAPTSPGGVATIDLAAADPESRIIGWQLANSADFSDTAIQPTNLTTTLATTTNWSFPSGTGTVWARVRNAAGTETITAASLGGARPDLVISDVSWSPDRPVRGGAVSFQATVTNAGETSIAAGSALDVSFYIDGVRTTWATINAPLAAGASTTVTADSGVAGNTWSATLGSHTINAVADAQQRIAEVDETNNARSETLSVSAGSISGAVTRTDGSGIANAVVTVVGGPTAYAVTAGDGTYTISGLDIGTYTVRAGMCFAPTQTVAVDGAETLDFVATGTADADYKCRRSSAQYVNATNLLALTGDNASQAVALPFPVSLFGTSYRTAYVSTNGFVTFASSGSTAAANAGLPSAAAPNAAVYPFWDDLLVDENASVLTAAVGSAPSRTFIVEWRNVRFASDATRRVSFEVWFYEDKRIRFEYRDIDGNALERGRSATIGIENAAGNKATLVSRNIVTVANDEALVFEAKPAPK